MTILQYISWSITNSILRGFFLLSLWMLQGNVFVRCLNLASLTCIYVLVGYTAINFICVIHYILAETWDFQQCGILTYIDSNKPVLSPVKFRDSKCCTVSSLTVI